MGQTWSWYKSRANERSCSGVFLAGWGIVCILKYWLLPYPPVPRARWGLANCWSNPVTCLGMVSPSGRVEACLRTVLPCWSSLKGLPPLSEEPTMAVCAAASELHGFISEPQPAQCSAQERWVGFGYGAPHQTSSATGDSYPLSSLM